VRRRRRATLSRALVPSLEEGFHQSFILRAGTPQQHTVLRNRVCAIKMDISISKDVASYCRLLTKRLRLATYMLAAAARLMCARWIVSWSFFSMRVLQTRRSNEEAPRGWRLEMNSWTIAPVKWQHAQSEHRSPIFVQSMMRHFAWCE
jgi:hypothetical protein